MGAVLMAALPSMAAGSGGGGSYVVLSRNTLQKWLTTPEEVAVPKYIRAKKFGKLAAFTQELALSNVT